MSLVQYIQDDNDEDLASDLRRIEQMEADERLAKQLQDQDSDSEALRSLKLQSASSASSRMHFVSSSGLTDQELARKLQQEEDGQIPIAGGESPAPGPGGLTDEELARKLQQEEDNLQYRSQQSSADDDFVSPRSRAKKRVLIEEIEDDALPAQKSTPPGSKRAHTENAGHSATVPTTKKSGGVASTSPQDVSPSKKQHPERSVACTQCDKMFTSRQRMNQHAVQKHGRQENAASGPGILTQVTPTTYLHEHKRAAPTSEQSNPFTIAKRAAAKAEGAAAGAPPAIMRRQSRAKPTIVLTNSAEAIARAASSALAAAHLPVSSDVATTLNGLPRPRFGNGSSLTSDDSGSRKRTHSPGGIITMGDSDDDLTDAVADVLPSAHRHKLQHVVHEDLSIDDITEDDLLDGSEETTDDDCMIVDGPALPLQRRASSALGGVSPIQSTHLVRAQSVSPAGSRNALPPLSMMYRPMSHIPPTASTAQNSPTTMPGEICGQSAVVMRMKRHIILLDLDNFSHFFQKLPAPLPDSTFVWCFHGGKQQWHEPKNCIAYDHMKQHRNVVIHTRSGTQRDAADQAIAVQAGRLDCLLPKSIPFTVISGDKGFLQLKRELEALQRQCHVVSPHHQEYETLLVKLVSIGEQ
eukprot:TRINITY_DN12814_c0_g1_i1.p1 TRINITY_DN12814_c0_g1~~TRINITY_DN12814_c0_g1_i1.p1  ORF type:complete len:638 (-),score=148.13 TRINITY_DN12814_c0_g1_i1:78-1991(-)